MRGAARHLRSRRVHPRAATCSSTPAHSHASVSRFPRRPPACSASPRPFTHLLCIPHSSHPLNSQPCLHQLVPAHPLDPPPLPASIASSAQAPLPSSAPHRRRRSAAQRIPAGSCPSHSPPRGTRTAAAPPPWPGPRPPPPPGPDSGGREGRRSRASSDRLGCHPSRYAPPPPPATHAPPLPTHPPSYPNLIPPPPPSRRALNSHCRRSTSVTTPPCPRPHPTPPRHVAATRHPRAPRPPRAAGPCPCFLHSAAAALLLSAFRC